MTEREYWDEINELAEAVTSEAKEYNRDLSEVIWETLDGHEFVIYYHQARQVAVQPCSSPATGPPNRQSVRELLRRPANRGSFSSSSVSLLLASASRHG